MTDNNPRAHASSNVMEIRTLIERWAKAVREKPVAFAFHDVDVTAGEDVAFATAVGTCVNIDPSCKREPLEFRLTMGLRKIDGRWRVMHEHHSLPAG
jgi:ketosteroid isomerase-like protein